VPATANGGSVIISTLDNPALGTDDNVTNTNVAMQFTMGSTAGQLGSVTLELFGGTGPIQVSLLNNAQPFTPGSLALNLGTIDPTVTGFSAYTLATPSPFTFAADTTYWLAVSYGFEALNQPGQWAFTNADPPCYTQSGTATTLDFAISGDGGATWAVGANAAFGPYIFEINSAGVPEPSALVSASIAVLFGIGVSIRKHYSRMADGTA
jgi:hypothetical protein